MGKSIAGKAFSIRFFLNKSVKPRGIKGKERYALYAQVNYDYKNTKVPVFDPHDYYLSYNELHGPLEPIYLPEKFFNDIIPIYLGEAPIKSNSSTGNYEFNVDSYALSTLPKCKSNLEKIARLEAARSTFRLKGLGKRLQSYYKPIGDHFQEHISKNIESFFSPDLVELYTEEGEYMELSGGSPLGRNPTVLAVIDWFFSNGYAGFHNSLPLSLIIDIELFLILAASKVGYHPLVDWLNNEEHFERLRSFLDSEYLFDSERELKIELSNYFSRYISLVPPSQPKEFYLERTKELISEQTKNIREKN